jgi:Flp pilus assembly protein CpaB
MVETRRYVGIAAISALAAAILFFMFLQRLSSAAGEAAAARNDAVVVLQQTEPGQNLTEGMMTLRRLPPSDIPANAITSIEEAMNKTAAVRLYPGEVLLRDRLGAVTLLSAAGSVAPSRVAFALKIKPETGVAVLIAPGDRVDVIGRLGNDPDEVDSILLSDVRVVGIAGQAPLADEPTADATPTPEPPNAQKILILDLTPDQAATLAQAIDTGAVYVSLKSSRRQ